MQITDNAKEIIERMLEEEKKNGITFFIEGQGCHSRLCMDFIAVSDGPQINGLFVDMSEETARMLENIILDGNEGNLVIKSLASSTGCGGCSGCGSGCDCGGCE